MHSNKSPPLTDKELKEAFAFYAEIFNSDDAEKSSQLHLLCCFN